MSTFVTIGNAKQSFSRLLKAVAEMANELPGPILVQHGHTPFTNAACNAVAFMDMATFEDAIASADLLITHAGAGTLIHAIRAGKRPVVMPRQVKYAEHIDNHQVELAGAFATAGKIEIAIEPADMRDALVRVLKQSLVVYPSPRTLLCQLLAERLRSCERDLSATGQCLKRLEK